MQQEKKNNLFWKEMNQLAASNPIVIDKSKGRAHPCYPTVIYPIGHDYPENKTGGDGSGIDVRIGSLNRKALTGILCTFDTLPSCRIIL
jgi:inorganic pyrophosphatase